MNSIPLISEESIKKIKFNKSDEYFTHNMLLTVSKNIINGNINTLGNIENSPKSFKKELKIHQKRILYEMIQKEKLTYRVSSGINMFVLADKVGSGKSIDVLALICKKPLVDNINNNKLIYKVNKYTHFTGIKFLPSIEIKSNLIIVPHTVYGQWIDYIKDFTGLKYLEIKSKKNIDNLKKEDLIDCIYDIIIVKSTKYVEFTKILYSFFPYNFKRIKNDNTIIPYEILNKLHQDIKSLLFNQEIDIDAFNNFKSIKQQLINIDTDNFEEKIKKYGNYKLNSILEFKGPIFQRVFIDEANSIKIPRFPYIYGKFNWFITSSVEDLLFPNGRSSFNTINTTGIKGTGFIKQTFIDNSNKNLINFIQDIYLKNNDDYVKQSFNLPEPQKKIVKCYTPPELKVLSSVALPEIINALNAGDINTAIKFCGCEELDENNLIEKVLENLRNDLNGKQAIYENKKKQQNILDNLQEFIEKNSFEGYIENYVFKLDSNGLGYYIDKITVLTKKNNLKKSIKLHGDHVKQLNDKIDSLKSRISDVNEKTCPICTQKVSNPSMTPCCKNIFCFECIMMSAHYSKKNLCPLCRTKIDIKTITNITSNIIPSETEEQKLPTKIESLMDIIKNKGKYLVFSEYDNSFNKIIDKFNEQNISWHKLCGSTDVIKNIIKKFQDGSINVLLLNAKYFGSGLNLQMTTDIILFHRMSNDLEKQIIGRGQRPGRVSPLKIHYLCYENELDL